MKIRISMVAIMVVLVSILLSGCTPTPPGPCSFTANTSLTAYRLPDAASDVFGTISTGDGFEILAHTADGWVGFDPGIAQAGNIGLAHHRWVQLNATVSPSCLTDIDLVTLADVQADVDASNP